MEVINLKEQLNRYRSSVGKDTIPFDSVLHDYDFAVARVVNNSGVCSGRYDCHERLFVCVSRRNYGGYNQRL